MKGNLISLFMMDLRMLTGIIHVGHAITKISKEYHCSFKIDVRILRTIHSRLGYSCLPIEQVLAKQGVKRKEMDLVEYL